MNELIFNVLHKNILLLLNFNLNQIQSLYKILTYYAIFRCLELCMYRLSDARKNVREIFLTLLKTLPLDKVLK